MRCLIVDDNRAFLEAARVLLEREGLTVLGVARSGLEALEQAQALQPDFVLVDVALGDESGFDVARSLVDDGRAGTVSVIMTSTRAEVDLGDAVADGWAHGFLPKSELSAQAIRRVLKRSELTSPTERREK
jgi:two-component system nitrate/nitrite response regulator NarL